MPSATPILLLVLIFGFGCRTGGSGLDVVERSKSSRPDWVIQMPNEVTKDPDGTLSFIAASAGATVLEKGVSDALEKEIL